MGNQGTKLEQLRAAIDHIDDQLLDLLNQRARQVVEVGRIKSEGKQEIYVPRRERAILERLTRRNTGPFSAQAVARVFREIISASLALEHPIRVAYLGPPATFTHGAALKQFGSSTRLLSQKTIFSVFEEVESGRSDYGVVPIENSNEGAVTHTLDRFVESEAKIIAEVYLEVSHHLLSKSGDMAGIRRICSHSQAIEQCRRWLEEHCRGIALQEVSSTARAAQLASEEEGTAAIAGAAAASVYDLRTLAAHIEDNRANYTRFLVIGRTLPQPTGRDKTSILFSFRDQPGILARMLEPFRKRDLNLAKIESRPVKKKAWEYMFFLDIEGHVSEERVAGAIDELQEFCTVVKVMGSYPRTR